MTQQIGITKCGIDTRGKRLGGATRKKARGKRRCVPCRQSLGDAGSGGGVAKGLIAAKGEATPEGGDEMPAAAVGIPLLPARAGAGKSSPCQPLGRPVDRRMPPPEGADTMELPEPRVPAGAASMAAPDTRGRVEAERLAPLE